MIAVGVMHRLGTIGWIVPVVVRVVRRAETVVVEPLAVGTHIDVNQRSGTIDDVGTCAGTVPPEMQRLEVFKGGEREKLWSHLIIRHYGVAERRVEVIERNVDHDSLDATRTDIDMFACVVVSVVRLEIDEEVAAIADIPNVLYVVIQPYGVRHVSHHGLRNQSQFCRIGVVLCFCSKQSRHHQQDCQDDFSGLHGCVFLWV